jgi:four helix bundle protein
MSDIEALRSRGYRRLVAWQRAMDFADNVGSVCDSAGRKSGTGLVSQLRRASISIPSNIAEGYGRPKREFLHYLRIAKGSLQEAETQLELLMRRGAATTETILQLLRAADELGRILQGLMRSVSAASA